MSVNAIIIDDEPRAHKIIETYLSAFPLLTLVGNFMNAVDALNFLQENKVDVVFLDISMPVMDGFAFLKKLSPQPYVIFTTAHPEFALESYDYDAVDYLTKPFSPERFSKAVTKALNLVAPKETGPGIPDRLELKIDGEIRTIAFETISYFQSLGNYIKVITGDRPLLTQMTTSEIEATLPKSLFIRIHKSYIVNLSKITEVKDDEIVVGTVILPIGKTFKKYVKDAMASR